MHFSACYSTIHHPTRPSRSLITRGGQQYHTCTTKAHNTTQARGTRHRVPTCPSACRSRRGVICWGLQSSRLTHSDTHACSQHPRAVRVWIAWGRERASDPHMYSRRSEEPWMQSGRCPVRARVSLCVRDRVFRKCAFVSSTRLPLSKQEHRPPQPATAHPRARALGWVGTLTNEALALSRPWRPDTVLAD